MCAENLCSKDCVTGAILMAAGAGRRMGKVPKALFEREGEALLLRQLRMLAQAKVDTVAVVLGHHATHLQRVVELASKTARSHARPSHLFHTTNPRPDDGPGTSLRCGLAALPAELTTYLVVLGDQPLLETEDIATLLQRWRQRPAGCELLVPQHDGRYGHPVIFGAGLRRFLEQQPGPAGLRDWRREHPEKVNVVEVPHPRCTTDIDTPEDVERLQRECGVHLTAPKPR